MLLNPQPNRNNDFFSRPLEFSNIGESVPPQKLLFQPVSGLSSSFIRVPRANNFLTEKQVNRQVHAKCKSNRIALISDTFPTRGSSAHRGVSCHKRTYWVKIGRLPEIRVVKTSGRADQFSTVTSLHF
eukprot:1193637-Prorocentrum_minimum.AAC.3